MGDHLSWPAVACRLERRTRFLGGPRQRNLLRLAPDGVWLAAVSPRRWWALTPPFHPYRRRHCFQHQLRRSPFCATVHRLSPSGVSPASCPAVSGLSSSAPPKRRARGHPACVKEGSAARRALPRRLNSCGEEAFLPPRHKRTREAGLSAWSHRFARALQRVRPARPLPVRVRRVSSLSGGSTRTVRSARGTGS